VTSYSVSFVCLKRFTARLPLLMRLDELNYHLRKSRSRSARWNVAKPRAC